MNAPEPVPTSPDPRFYTVGGALKSGAPSYIERAADRQLCEALLRREFCYVLTPRQMGKSSLMVRTANRLQQEGVLSVIIDLTGIGSAGVSVESWYLGQLTRIAGKLCPRFDCLSWWEQHSHLSTVQRFSTFLDEVVLGQVPNPVVIFVDEIDTTLNLPYSDDYFAAIRALYNGRPVNPELERLTFVLLGVAAPSQLIKDSQRTPFNIGTRVELTDFQPKEARPLAIGLAPDPLLAEQLLDQVLLWTGGHPYLTQKACVRVAEWARTSWKASDAPLIVDDLIKDLFFSDSGRNTDDNLAYIRDRLLKAKLTRELLALYRRIRTGEVVYDNELDPVPIALKLSGLVKATESGTLVVRNLIYQSVFDMAWARREPAERPRKETPPESRYDAFISYSHRDADWVWEWLVPRLKAAGLTIATDQETFEIGVPSLINMENAVAASRHTILVLTPAYLASEWTMFEQILTQTHDPVGLRQRAIPVLLKPCDMPKRIAMLTCANLTGKLDKEREFTRMVEALGGTLQPSRPSGPPLEPPSQIPTRPTFDTAAVRQLVTAAFSDEELVTFCYDYYPSVHSQFATEMSKPDKIQRLIEYVLRREGMDVLLDRVAQVNPHQYRRFADRLVQSKP